MASALTESAWEAAQRLVQDSLGASIRLSGGPAPQSVGIRSRVARVEPVGGRGDVESLVVKQRVDATGCGYDPGDRSTGSFATRVAYESAALRFLAGRAAPRLIGVDYQAGVIVMEDLGEGSPLLESLDGDDPERADQVLAGYSTAMGELHARSAGRREEFSTHLTRHGRRPADPLADVLPEWVSRFEQAIEAVGCAATPEVRDHFDATVDRIGNPGPFHTLTHGDICPGHDRAVGARTVFIDWELAGFRHGFYDLAYLYVPFPSCGYAGRVPAGSRASAVAAYRKAAAPGIPAVADDETFHLELLYGWTVWIVRDVGGLLPAALDADADWGTATHRQRILQLLDGFARSAALQSYRPSVAAWFADLRDQLRRRWPDCSPVPIYPAYQASRKASGPRI